MKVVFLVCILIQIINACLTNYQYYDYVSGECLPCAATCMTCYDSTICVACVSQYFLDDDNACQPCPFGCGVCSGASQCTSCKQGLYMDSQGSCLSCLEGVQTCTIALVQSCANGYFMLGQICAGCIDNCDKCSDFATCNLCTQGYYKSEDETQCLSCPQNCLVCTDSSTCTSCNKGYEISAAGGCQLPDCSSVSTFCIKCSFGFCLQCQRGKHTNSDGTCSQGASLLCQQSVGPYHTNCQTSNYGCPQFAQVQTDIYSGAQLDVCIPFHASPTKQYIYIKNLDTICDSISSCSDPYSANIEFQSLKSFYKIEYEINIKMYAVSAHQLTISYLQNSTVLTSQAITTDITQQFSEGLTDSSCSNCPYGITIVSGQLLVSGGISTATLQLSSSNGYIYPLQTIISLSVCKVENCEECTTAIDCKSCQYPFLLQLIECVSQCDTGFYKFGDTCVLQCPQISYPILASYECKQCQSPCATCYSQTQCLSCVQGFYIQDTSCLSQCSTQQLFTNFTSGECEECPNPCLQCQIGNSTLNQTNSSFEIICISCRVGYVLENGQCVYLCPNGTFANFINNKTECTQCASQCIDCYIQQTICVSCQNTFLLSLDTSFCQSNYSCPEGYYQNQSLNTCQKCHYPCKSCQMDGWNCSSCIKGSLYNNQCPLYCPQGMYTNYLLSSSTCQPCASPCATCISQSICLSCENGTYLYQGMCYIECPVQTVYELADNNTCQLCESPCSKCLSATECLSCSTGFIDTSTHKCVLQCNQSSYVNSDFECQQCSTPCFKCYENASCLQCQLPYVLQEQSCISASQCQNMDKYVLYMYDYSSGTPLQQSAVCTSCTYPCASCSSSPIVCTTCAHTYLLVTQLYTCSQECPLSYYQSGSTCQKCDGSCLDCEVSADNCTQCGTGMFLQDNKCIMECDMYYYGDNIQSQCKPCQLPCLQCYNLYLCKSCQTGIFYNKVCIDECPEGTIQNQTSNECETCTDNCYQCYAQTSNCTSCSNGYYFFENTCLQSCPPMFYADSLSKNCQNCYQPCKQCESSIQCLSCIDGYYLYETQCLFTCPQGYFQSTELTCQPCNLTICRTCSIDANNCTKCAAQYYYDSLQSDSCVETCPASTYANSYSLTCQQCIYPCTQCTAINICQACQDTYKIYNDLCYSSCPIGYFSTSNKTCVQCFENCQICSNQTYCSKCVSQFYADSMGQCLQECSQGYYAGYDPMNGYPKCLSCPLQCKSCSQYYLCTQCSSQLNYTLYLFNGLCLDQCPFMHYPVETDNTCSSCPQNCNKCSNSTVCQQCLNSYMYNFICYLQCPATTYLFNQQSCIDCSSPCYECTGQFACTTCLSGYFYFMNYCLQSCPQDVWTYPQNKSCSTLCPYNKYQKQMECYVSGCGGMMVQLQGYCLEQCPLGYYVSLQQNCVKCTQQSTQICNNLLVGSIQVLRTQNLKIAIYFSQAVNSASIDESKIEVTLTNINQNQNQQKVAATTHTSTQQQQQLYIISNVQYNQNMIIIQYNYNQLSLYTLQVKIPYIQSQQSQQSISSNYFTATIYSYNDYSQQKLQSIPILNIIALVFCILMFVCIIVNVVVKSSGFFQLLDFMQFVAATLYLQIQYPPVLEGYLKGLSAILWSFEPQAISFSPYAFSPSKYIEYYTDTSLLRAHTIAFLVFLLVFITFTIVILVNKYNPQLCRPAVKRIKYRNLTDLFGIFMLPLLIFAFHFNNASPADIVCSVLVIALSLSYLILISYKLITTKNSKQLPGLMGDMEEMENTLGKLYTPFSFIRKIIFALVLCLQPDQPISTLTILLIFTILIMVCLFFYQPFENIVTDYVCIFMETILIIFICFLILFGLNVTDGFGAHIMGIVAVVLTLLAILGGLGWLIYLSYQSIKKFATQNSKQLTERLQTAEDAISKTIDGQSLVNSKLTKQKINKNKKKMMENQQQYQNDQPSANSLLGKNINRKQEIQQQISQNNQQFRHWRASDSQQSEQQSVINGNGPPRYLMKKQLKH